MRNIRLFWFGLLALLFGCMLIFSIFSDESAEHYNDITAIISFNGSSAQITGSGAVFSNRTLSITQPGIYLLSGALDNGQVYINAGRNDDVQLVLNGVTLHNETGPAIYSPRSNEVMLVLGEGSVNIVSDGSRYAPANDSNNPDAAIFVQDSLRITGGGVLSVSGNYKHGIRAQDFLTVTGGVINVDAAGDALRGRDGVIIQGGNFTLNAGGDGIQSNNANSGDVGFVSISGGAFYIQAQNDGIQAESILTVTGGVFDIFTGGGSANAPVRVSNFRGGWGRFPGTASRPLQEDSVSMKGLKAGILVNIMGGDFTIDSEDDGVHSNGNITISSGKLFIKTGDDGIHADGSVVISGGEINIPVSYEGIEGLSVTISGGNITVFASDDALNAADGNANQFGGTMGRGRGSINENIFVRISGGTVDLHALHDGIDSNGNGFLEGGTVMISGPSMGMNGAIDLDGTMLITGGQLITAGSVINISGNSTQPFLYSSYGRQLPSGSIIAVKDAGGNTLLEYNAKIAFSMSGFTSPFFRIGETYSVFINDEKHSDINLNSVITSAGSSGGNLGGGRGGIRGNFNFQPRL